MSGYKPRARLLYTGLLPSVRELVKLSGIGTKIYLYHMN